MTLEESTKENDIVTTSRSIKVAYEKELDEYLNDVTIDYEDTGYGEGFSMSGRMLGDC